MLQSQIELLIQMMAATAVGFSDEVDLKIPPNSGRTKVGSVLRGLLDGTKPFQLPTTTAILILQDLAAEELEEAFDAIDVVVKTNGCSTVHVDGDNSFEVD